MNFHNCRKLWAEWAPGRYSNFGFWISSSWSASQNAPVRSVFLKILDKKCKTGQPTPQAVGRGLTRAPMEYSRTLPADGGGGCFAPPPAICQTNHPILDPKTVFDSPGLDFPNMLQKFIWTALMTSQVGWKVKFLNICHCSLASPGKAAASNWNKADGTTWIVSLIILSTLLSILWPCVKSRSSKVTRSIKVKLIMMGLSGLINVFRSDFRQERKKSP